MLVLRRWIPAVAAAFLVSCGASGASVPVTTRETRVTSPGATGSAVSVAANPLLEAPDTMADPPVTMTGDSMAPTAASTPSVPSTEPIDADPVDDPSFELGPDIVLDVDVARFPIDDAGVGGGADREPANDIDNDAASGPDGDSDSDRSTSSVPTGWEGFDASLRESLMRPENTAVGVAVLIDGDVVHQAAFGVRDRATGDPSSPDDRFRVASISKTITAIVALRLVDDGVIALDDPVGQLVADHIGMEDVGTSANLTLRQLLTHRSGFGKYDTTFFRGGSSGCADAARQGLQSGATGGGYTYSNMNYCVAGLAIEAMTGLSYEQAVYRELLTPLGISGMRLAPTIDPGPGETQHLTTSGRNYMETLGAAGSWIASPTELVTIMDSLDHSTPGFKPLDESAVSTMITPFAGEFGQRGYGYGMISYGGGRFGHTGTIESTHAMLLNRGDGVTWAVTVAGQTPSQTTALEQIVNAAFAAGGFVAA